MFKTFLAVTLLREKLSSLVWVDILTFIQESGRFGQRTRRMRKVVGEMIVGTAVRKV